MILFKKKKTFEETAGLMLCQRCLCMCVAEIHTVLCAYQLGPTCPLISLCTHKEMDMSSELVLLALSGFSLISQQKDISRRANIQIDDLILNSFKIFVFITR